METAVGVESQGQDVGDSKQEPQLGVDVHQSGEDTAEIVLTPTDASPAGGEILGAGEPQTNNNKMGINSSQPAVSLTKIAPIDTNGAKQSSADSGHKKDIDDVRPASNLTTTALDGIVKIRMSDTGRSAEKPITVQTFFKQTVEKIPNGVALGVKRDGKWIKYTYRQYYDMSRNAAKALIKLGLEPCHGMGILGFNSPEWFISYFGAIFAGGKATGIYTTNSAEACAYVLSDCQANVMVVENHAQLQKILKVWETLPHLKAIVQYTGEVAERRENIYSWEEFMNLGADVPDSALDDRSAHQAPNACCSLIYTSGTTGNPKAVMISHDNITWTSAGVFVGLNMDFGKDVFISFLPLSHIAGQMVDIFVIMKAGGALYFAQPDALKGTLGDTWKEIRPTAVLVVPRVWEKIQEKMVAQGATAPKMKKKLIAWAKDKGLRGIQAHEKGEGKPWGWSLANILVFKKVRALLGLDRCKTFGSAAAPIMKSTLEFFAALNIRIDEVYGMSESTGPQTFCVEAAYKMTSVGREFSGAVTKLDQPDEEGNGEICFYGRHVFMGYLNEPEKTKEAVDDEGWLHSGDIGKKDEGGYLYITGRIKEILITAGGENIAPVPVEDNVKQALPCVSNCMLIGDKRKFLSMLIMLRSDMNLDTQTPLDTLTPDCMAWCKTFGSDAKTVTEALADQNILKGIQAGIDKANEKAVSRAAKIQKWSLLPKDFSLSGGELGPTLKLRRAIVVKKYEKTISAFYEESDAS